MNRVKCKNSSNCSQFDHIRNETKENKSPDIVLITFFVKCGIVYDFNCKLFMISNWLTRQTNARKYQCHAITVFTRMKNVKTQLKW